MIEEAELGKRIKQYRKDRGLTLQELAEKTGYTKGYLSKIENSGKGPPVSVLINISKTLDISISDIFGEPQESSPICVVKKRERRSIARDGSLFGYAYETLAHNFPKKHMQPFIAKIPLNPKENVIFQHKGEEMSFLLEGKAKFFHGEKEFILEEGDCVYFDAGITHYAVSLEDKEAICLLVIYTPE
jgi:transcriptional regulator with XRE-family HTH domain